MYEYKEYNLCLLTKSQIRILKTTVIIQNMPSF